MPSPYSPDATLSTAAVSPVLQSWNPQTQHRTLCDIAPLTQTSLRHGQRLGRRAPRQFDMSISKMRWLMVADIDCAFNVRLQSGRPRPTPR
jgi:hypothetical protein